MMAALDCKRAGPAVALPSTFTAATLNCEQGLNNKLPRILEWANIHTLDCVALQETGDSIHQYKLLRSAGYFMILDPLLHAGVALLLNNKWHSCVRRELRHTDDSGRLLGVHLEYCGTHLLLITLYMPTSLDRVALDSPDGRRASALYSTAMQWVAAVPSATAIIMGDLNETITAADRHVVRNGTHQNRFISCLSRFTDCYRFLHPSGGWTCTTQLPDGKTAEARLDYIFALGHTTITTASVTTSPVKTRHKPVVVQLQLSITRPPPPPVSSLSLPNMRTATEEQKKKCVAHFEQWLVDNGDEFVLGCSGNSDSISAITDSVLRAAQSVCASTLPTCSRKPFMSADRIRLSRQRTKLNQLKSFLTHAVANPATLTHDGTQLHRLVRRCGKLVDPVSWGVVQLNPSLWLKNVSAKLNRIRRAERLAVWKMRFERDRWSTNPAAFVRSMIHGEKQADLSAIIDPDTDDLVATPTDVNRVFHDHYKQLFAPSSRPVTRPGWVDSVYAPKSSINPDWYHGLMDAVTTTELRTALATAKPVCAPGRDGISAGVWKVLISSEVVCTAICLLLSACLRERTTPTAARCSVIVPILKKQKELRRLSNIRPLSLQCALLKILWKVLATRLGHILATHPILHPAQQGFLPGGSSAHCVNTVLDIWEDAAEKKDGSGVYSLFYDIKQAYDCVRHDDLLLSLRRLGMPENFVAFIADSLQGMTSCVRTAHGLTDMFDVLRSLRQGDPLSPLLFICYLDPLHCGLDTNPIDKKQYGYRIANTVAGSMGLADDTVAFSGTYHGLCKQNEWSCSWMRWMCGSFQPAKCVLACMRDGKVVPNTSIRINAQLLTPVAMDHPTHYLGAHLQLNLDTNGGINALTGKIHQYCNAIEAHNIRPDRAIWIINTFLIPSISYALPFVFPSQKTLRQWDTRVSRAICTVSKQPHRFKTEALSCVTGLILPSHHNTITKLSECFVRLNSTGSEIARDRWLRKDRSGSLSRTKSICKMAVAAGLSLVPTPRVRSPSEPVLPPPGVRRTVDGAAVVFGPSINWGASYPVHTYTAYTDGSCIGGRSAWAVCFQSSWLRASFGSVPSEDMLVSTDIKHSIVVGAALEKDEGSGVFDAELQAITRALLAPPVTGHIHIYTDSQASITAINSFQQHSSQRAKMRMAGFSILHLIDTVIRRRNQCNSTTTFTWIDAHSSSSSLHHVGNRIADFVAKRHAGINPPSLNIAALNLVNAHPFITLKKNDCLLVGDPRKHCRKAMQVICHEAWMRSRSQSRFSGLLTNARALWDAALHHSPSHLSLVLRVVTDTLQWSRIDGAVVEKHCRYCRVPMTVAHITTCSETSKRERAGAGVAVCRLLAPLSHRLHVLATHCSTQADLLGTLKRFGIIAAISSATEVEGVLGLFSADIATSALRRLDAADNIKPILAVTRMILLSWLSRVVIRIF